MKCKYARKFKNGYNQCQRNGTVRKQSKCGRWECTNFEPTFWDRVKYLLTYGQRWRP